MVEGFLGSHGDGLVDYGSAGCADASEGVV